MPDYKRPPIVEAVIEIRFAGTPLEDRMMEALGKRFSDRYPTPPQQAANVGVEVVGTTIRVVQQNAGFKIHSVEGGSTVHIGRAAIGTSKNAPYAGWDDFIGEARKNWAD